MAGLKATLRGGVYYATGTVAGRRIRASLGTRDEALANELTALEEAKLWKRHHFGDQAVRTFEEAALSYMQAGGERTYLPPIIRKLKGRVLGAIAPEDIREVARQLYPDDPVDPGARNATRNRNVLTPARAVINHAHGRGWCGLIRVEAFPARKTRRKAADRAWLDAFLARADADGLPHLAAAVLFMAQTGARASEAVRILPDHVDLKRRTIELAKTKTDDWPLCHITRELVLRIANLDHLQEARSGATGTEEAQPLFGYASRFGLYRRMRAVCRRAAIPFLSPHQAGRHTFATTALAGGATVKQVMEGGRWKSAAMVLEIYAHAEQAGREVARQFDTELAQSKRRQARKRASSRRKSA